MDIQQKAETNRRVEEKRYLAYQEIYASAAHVGIMGGAVASNPNAKANKTLQTKKTLNGPSSLSNPVRDKMSAEGKLNLQKKENR